MFSGHHHHHHHGFGHHHHHGFGHHHHHHGIGPGIGAVAVGTAAGLAAGALAGSVLARPSPRYASPYASPEPMPIYPAVAFAPAPMVINPAPIVASPPLTVGSISIGMAQQRLGVASVQIPAFGMQKQNEVTHFTINVFPDDGGAPWQVLRRYRQFSDLSVKLNLHRNINTPFPRKHFTGCEGSKLEQRRRGLETWLASVIQASPSVPSWFPWLREFLEVGLHNAPVVPSVPVQQAQPLQLAPATPSVQLAQPVLPAPSTPSAQQAQLSPQAPSVSAPPLPSPESPHKEGNIASPGGDSNECMVMEITVPPGVAPGQVLDVTVQSGRQVLLEIPEGAVAGQNLQVWYDPVRGTLQPFK